MTPVSPVSTNVVSVRTPTVKQPTSKIPYSATGPRRDGRQSGTAELLDLGFRSAAFLHVHASFRAESAPLCEVHYLFCRRFDGERAWDKLLELSRRATMVVLGGDIFDFRWTTRPTIEQSAQEAIQLLASLVRKNRRCEFHYVMGNHDHHQLFLSRLDDLAGDEANFSWHPSGNRGGG